MTCLERHVLRRYDTWGWGFLLILVFVILGFLRRAKHCHMLFQQGISGGVLMGTSNGNVPCLFWLSFCKGGIGEVLNLLYDHVKPHGTLYIMVLSCI